MRETYDFPAFREVTQWLPSAKSGRIHSIRPNRVLVRPYYPSGYRKSGLWVSRNEKHPPVFGHIVGLAEGIDRYTHPTKLEIGDQVMFRRFAIEVIDETELQEPEFEGEKAPIALLHVKSIQAVFRPPIVSMKV